MVEARSIGPIAGQVSKRPSLAKTIASFGRSFYLEADGHLICVASDNLHNGPFNILIKDSGQGPVRFGFPVTVGQRWTFDAQSLSSFDGPEIGIDLSKALTWQPKAPPKNPIDHSQLFTALEELKKLAASRQQSDGLLSLVLDKAQEPNSATGRAAIAPLNALSEQATAWLSDGDLRILSSLDEFLGLGPGLTPSGDDLIAGMLIACHHVGRGRGALELWRQLQNRAKTRTTPISIAHLSAAGQGMGAAPLHDLLDALIENRTDKLRRALDAVARIGHCSGMDAVGGLLVLFDAWIAAGNGQAASAA